MPPKLLTDVCLQCGMTREWHLEHNPGHAFDLADPTERSSMGARSDGLGQPLDDVQRYFVQDARQRVGNCMSWWCDKGAGYTCNLAEAGEFSGEACRAMRGTDVPWPVEYVRLHTVVHVRGDASAFSRHRYRPGPR